MNKSSCSHSVLAALAAEIGANAIVVSKEAADSANGVVVAALPTELAPMGSLFPAIKMGAGAPNVERSSSRISAIVPLSIRLRLPTPVQAALSAPLGSNGLKVLLVWCTDAAPQAQGMDALRAVLSRIASLAQCWDEQRDIEAKTIRLGAVVCALDQAVVSIDDGHLVGYINLAAARLLGVPAGTTASSLLASALAALQRRAINQEEIQAMARDLLAAPQATIRDVIWRFDREPTHLRVTTAPFADGALSGRTWVFDDVSVLANALDAAQQARLAQAASEERFRLVAENASDVVFRASNEGVIEWISPSVTPLVGWLPQEMIGQPFDDFVEPDDLPIVRAAQREVAAGNATNCEARIRMRSNGSRWISFSVKPIYDGNGKLALHVGGWRDTQFEVASRNSSNQMLAALQRSETRLQLAAAAASIGIWTWDSVTDRIEWDERMYQLYGLSQADRPPSATYETWRSCVHPDDLEHAEAEIARARKLNVECEFEFRIILPDGAIRYIYAVAVVETDGDGQQLRLIGVNRDITRSREYEQELLAARQIAEAASRAKGDFLANVSHEIRTPMHAILGTAQILERSRLDAQQASYVATIRTAGRSMLALINDVLDLAKIEAGHLELATSPFELATVVSSVIDTFAPITREKGVALRCGSLPDDLPALKGDAIRLGQILSNLIGNAIKFTPQGEVIVSVTVERRDTASTQLRFAVRDTGVGIEAAKIEGLFNKFTQADASIHEDYGGTGLGLAISRQLVTAMGGEIGVTSEPGLGSEFWFSVPFVLVDLMPLEVSTPALVNQRERLAGVRILIVDDSLINCAIAAKLLAHEGAYCETAASGREALARLSAGPQDFDIVLMDVQMPEMDGLETTRAIRGELGLAALPVIALTAGALQSQRESAQAAGMNGFVTKPFELDALLAAVRALLEQRCPDRASHPAPPNDASAPADTG